MNNKKNVVLKPIISVGFDKTGKIESYVNGDRIKQIKNVRENIDALIKEVTQVSGYVFTYRPAPLPVAKTKIASLKKTVPSLKANATTSKIVKYPLNKKQFAEVNKLIESKQLLQAVKLVKEYSGIGLKEAKDVVDSIIFNSKK